VGEKKPPKKKERREKKAPPRKEVNLDGLRFRTHVSDEELEREGGRYGSELKDL